MTSAHWRQTGGIWPLGVPTSLTWYDFGALLTLIQLTQPRLVVEIGVEHGGAAALLAAACDYAGATYRGIDITLNPLHPAVRERLGPHLYERDAWADATIAEVARWLAETPSPALLFVDGGNKPHELRLYAPLLRSGDVIVAHDYGNEYGEAQLHGLPADLECIQADWLNDTLLCAFGRP